MAGRPKKDISESQVYEMALIGCTYEEIARVLGCDKATLVRRFQKVIEDGAEEGKMSIRRKQREVALSGDRTMLIWLGKQMGQSDRVRSDITSGGDKIQPIIQVSTKGAEELQKLSEGK